MHDELRRLDEDLAAGRLDADTYRRRRDELLAARLPGPPPLPSPPAAGSSPDEVATDEVDAVATGRDAVDTRDPASAGAAPPGPASESPAPESPAPEGPAPAEPDLDGPVAAGSASEGPAPDLDGPVPRPAGDVRDPFPPPFRWNGDGAGGSDAVADATQVVAARPAADDVPERTQVVRGAPDGRLPPGAADATQVVGRSGVRVPGPRPEPWRSGPLAPPAAPAAPERTQFVPGAALTRAGDLRSVPARRTVPPWADERATGPADARRPGREVFARGRGPSPAAVLGTAALVVVVLVVLALSFLLG